MHAKSWGGCEFIVSYLANHQLCCWNSCSKFYSEGVVSNAPETSENLFNNSQDCLPQSGLPACMQ